MALAEQAKGPGEAGGAREQPEGGALVLVVDDSSINRYMLSQHVRQLGHRVETAENGREALEMMEGHGFDLVLLDILMAEMDGFEVLRRLKADERFRHLPVIMISALGELEGVVRCIEMGAEDYLPKPFNPVILRARIGACLDKKRRRDQEIEYLRSVAEVTDAAAAVETGEFDLGQLDHVSGRPDELGQLARVFQRMAREVQAREQRLKQQLQRLTIQIDEGRKESQVAEITETEYFQELKKKARDLRGRAA